MIGISDEAHLALARLLEEEGDPMLFVRLRAEGSGCDGYSYELTLDDVPRKGDAVTTVQGITVRIDASSRLLLEGSLLDVGEAGLCILPARMQFGCTTCSSETEDETGDETEDEDEAGDEGDEPPATRGLTNATANASAPTTADGSAGPAPAVPEPDPLADLFRA